VWPGVGQWLSSVTNGDHPRFSDKYSQYIRFLNQPYPAPQKKLTNNHAVDTLKKIVYYMWRLNYNLFN